MQQKRAGGGARRLRIGATTCAVPWCDPRTGPEPPKSGPSGSPPPPGWLYRALIKSIEPEPVHHGRATDTILHILLCSSRMLTTRHNEACNERGRAEAPPGPYIPRLTPPSAQQPPWHPRCRNRARFRRRWRQCPPNPPSQPQPRHSNRGRERPRRACREWGGRRAPSTEKMFLTPPRGAQKRQPSLQREMPLLRASGGGARRRLALR